MKQKLEEIYRELSAGKLSRPQALERIKSLNQPQRKQAFEISFAAPAWERCAPAASTEEAASYAQHHVLLCDLPHIAAAELEALLPPCRCAIAPTSQADAVPAVYTAVALAYFETIQRILQQRPQGRSLLQLVVAECDETHMLAGLHGLIETAALENPDVTGQIVFVKPDIASADLAQCLRTECHHPRERVVRYAGNTPGNTPGNVRWSRRWRRIEAASIAAEVPCAFKEQGVYLITGGLGGLGMLLAKEILHRTSGAKIFLTGRSAAKDAQLAALQHAGRVEYRQVDVADGEVVERLLASIVDQCGQLNGIIHSAGILRDDFILKKSSAQFTDVLQPKVAGTANLDFASQAMGLDFFVLFSSIASWAGNAGQADYAAANGFMDQFAGHRNALVAAGKRKGKTLAIAWPHWLDGGMNVDATSMARLQQRTGLRSLQTEQGMEALHRCLALSQDAVMVMPGNTADLARALDAERMLRPQTSPPVKRVAAAAAMGATVDNTREFLRREFSPVLKIPVHRIETGAALENYGIDSIVAMNLTTQLEATFGALPKTLFFEYQTIDELADYLARAHADKLQQLQAVSPRAAAAASTPPVIAAPRRSGRRDRQRFLASPTQPSANSEPHHEPIAIVGLSGRYPASKDLEEFWRNLRDGKDCITEVPRQRWDWRQHYSEDRSKEGAHYSKWGGFIEGADEFDPRFFNISPREAPGIDPQERMFLQHAWMAIEDAGYTRARLQIPNAGGLAGQVGVYAGVMYGEYNISGTLASIANRVSYFLNLHGPSLTLDTMCSSSLTAIHLACQDLRSGRTSLALAGGVNLSLHHNKYRMLSAGQFISGDGHCQSFGEGGDGYIPGEGVGVAVLKRLSEAERDGDHIYSVIRGSALNHGGKTNGYTVPNPQAQAEVIRRALIEAGVDPRHMSYIEAHGTGTKLGDPIEIAALTKAFYDDASVREAGSCLIGSAKSNIGHCESAAGIAGVTKVVLQMKHASIVPSLHSAKLNPHIDFKTTPFVVNQTLRSWEQPVVEGRRVPRIAGISSFGAGGSNAHVIIEEYRAPEPQVAAVREQLLVPLSARTAPQLQQRVRDLLAFLQRAEHTDLRAMAWTLQVGREAMEERAAFLAISVDDLTAKLQAFLQGHDAGDAIHCAQVKQHKEALAQLIENPDFHATFERWIEARELPPLAQLWVKGLDLDWRKLLDAGAPRLMSLPTYPFATERYWIEPSTAAAVSPIPMLHPLVHANTSNILQQRYTSRFTAREAFLTAAAAGPQMSPLLVLEMIRAAVELAAPPRSESGQWELRETAWGEPLSICSDRNVDIALFPRADDAIDVEIYSDQVHCQSHAVHSSLPAPARVDLERLQAASAAGQVLASLRLPARSGNEGVGYGLHPELLQQVAQLLERSAGAAWSPTSLARLRLVFPCPQNVVVWSRHSSSSVDIDVCDEQGNVCVQMIGLRGDTDARIAVAPIDTAVLVEPVAAVAPAQSRAPVAAPREIALVTTPAPARQFEPISQKPTGVRLLPSAEIPSAPVPAKAQAVLAALSAWPSSAAQDASAALRLFDLGAGVYAIEMQTGSFAAAIEPLWQALNRVRNQPSLKALLLIGRHADSWRGDRNACNTAIERRLLSAVVALACPVIAVAPGDAVGAGFLLASVCDFLVCSEEGQYGFTDFAAGIFPSGGEARLFRERLGDVVADDLLYRSTQYSGRQLKAKGWACRVTAPAQVEVDARRLAAELSRKSQLALGLLKTHLSRQLAALIDDLHAVEVLPAAIRAAENASESALVFTLGADRDDYDLPALIADLKLVLDRAEASSGYKSVVLASALDGFLPEADQVSAAAAVAELKHLVERCPLPVIAAFESNAHGLAWLFGLFCDAVVYRRDGRYAASALWTAPLLAREVAVLCAQRFGTLLGQEVCLTEGSYSGAQLQARVGALLVVERDEVMFEALRCAVFWDAWPRQTIVAWKQAQSALRQQRLARLPPLQISEDESAATDSTASAPISTPKAIALGSSVVHVTAYPEGVVAISMQEREAKNMFSAALVDGLKQAFAHIAQTSTYKAVVLTGYDNYFATGGTMETLLAIQQGQAKFTDEKVFQLPMDCPLPVIAAIQGHGIGGGWSFGMYSDLILLSEESRYLSPYMGYGFTPGAGSTLMFPEKIGYDLARETLLTAQEMSGHELQQRGAPLPVLPRAEVVSSAIELARRMARQPRARLIALKRLWTQALRESREEVYRREVEMHERTFVSNRETWETIQSKISLETGRVQVVAAEPARAELPASSVVQVLKTMLAQELFLKPEEIDDDTQFIDLGLDSITGVTWIRKINAHYGTDIEATKVYSHPTLKQLGGLVAGEAVTIPNATPVAHASPRDGDSLDGVIANLKAMLAKELLLRVDEIDESVPFIDLGLDSITGVTWVRKINEHYGTDIEATKVYGHPTLLELGRLVKREAGRAAAPLKPIPTAAVPAPARRALTSWRRQARAAAPMASHAMQPIAVIGVAGQFPKAKNLEEFWTNLAEGRNCIAEVPDTRWQPRAHFQPGAPVPGKTNSKWLGALDEYDLFDPLFFNISPTEAECMEPQQRLFLQACWHSIENAGYNPHALAGSDCGVFVGCGPSDYHQASPAQQLSAQGFTGAASSILAARISYFLNLRGPCMAIETACSSSLVAIATACDSLNGGNSDLALAGGVYVMAGPNMHVMTAQAGMLSTDGRCFSFDQRANGFVPGEAVGALVLKRLADAERDQDRIQAVIEGWGVNQDGKTNGITAPNEESQTRLIQSVYRKFGIDPAGIQLIEAHGTGTKLGDPIEVAGLKAAFRSFTDKSGFCALGTVKSNIGHCLTAAGVAGFIKVILALKHKSLPPTINFEHRNEHIKLDGSSFYVNDTLKPWDVAHGGRRRAAISSFGFSGTNAHLVIAEHLPPARAKPEISVLAQDGKVIVPLSAKTPAQLRQKAQQMLAFLSARAPSLDLVEVAYTLQIGREHMEERVGFLVDSLQALTAQLEAYLAGQGDDIYQGQIKRHKEGMKLISQDDEIKATIIEKWLGRRQLSKLLELWVKGLDFDYSLLYGAAKPRRLELPGYPFAKERFWIDGSAQKPEPVTMVPRWDVVSDVDARTEPVPVAPLKKSTVEFCKQLVGKVLKLDPHRIDAAEPLERYGIDSMVVGRVNEELRRHFGDIRSTLLYEFQTVDALAEYLVKTQRPTLERLFVKNAVPNRTPADRAASLPPESTLASARTRIRSQTSRRQPIAIIGLSGLYPGASDVEEFWENLKAGKNSITAIPDKRWSLEGFYEPDVQKAVELGKSYCKWGGFVDQFAEFDTLFFGIPPKEALNMDPQERLFMQAAWSALENSGYSRGALRHQFNRRVGVFAGITRAGYNLYRTQAQPDDKFWPRTSFSSVANRLSYFLDINGPSLPVDTMCSSSLTAIHEACEHIHNGDCDLAFAGGVNLYLHPTSYVDMSSQRMLSKAGLCMSFGAGGDGFVPGEGVGVVLLKSLDRALADNDVIHGLILATHVNHGGKTNGFTVPNPVAQAELIRAALDKAHISARDISYIEAHGTGTELGDPIEITGLQQAFAQDSQDTGYCRIGSAKSNIGHLEAAAGIAGLTKVLLQLKHRQIAPSLHAATLNPHIDFGATAFEVNRALVDWERPVVNGTTKPRIAGISSFGAGGANAHVILQEYLPANTPTVTAPMGNHPGDSNDVIVPLSAKTTEQLQQRASDLFDFLSKPASVDLAALAYTLQTGREPMEMRVGFVVNSVEQLMTKLSAYVYGEREIDGVRRGEVQRGNDTPGGAIDQWVARKEYSTLLESWVEGLEFDWNRLYGAAQPPRIQLPTYPFAQDEYWLDGALSRSNTGRSNTGRSNTGRSASSAGNSSIIEEIINKIDADVIDAAHGVQLLKQISR